MGGTWKPCAAQIKTNKEMMGAPLSPLWPGGRGGRERETGGGRRRRRRRRREEEEEEEEEERGGSLASSLICKKCITSEIKRKITAPKQNTQSRSEEAREGDGWGVREGEEDSA